MVWYGMVWYGMVWYGMVWYGMVWYGIAWYGTYGMVWHGIVSIVSYDTISKNKISLNITSHIILKYHTIPYRVISYRTLSCRINITNKMCRIDPISNGHLVSRLGDLSNAKSARPAEDDDIEERVSAETVGPVHRGARRLPGREQTRDSGVVVNRPVRVLFRLDHLDVVVVVRYVENVVSRESSGGGKGENERAGGTER